MSRLRFILGGLLLLLIAAVFVPFHATAPKSNAPVSKPKAIRLLTYNVLDDERSVPERGPALLKIIKDLDPDIVALQELTPAFVTLLGKEDWIRQSYKMRSEEGEQLIFEELCILSKFPILHLEFRRLPGWLRRSVLVATISAHGRTLAVATSHLDSFMEDGPTRAEQMDLIFPMLKSADDAVFMGDFNFGDGEEPDTSHIDKSYADLWRTVFKDDPGYTWNIERSEMAKKGSFPDEKSRRLDRILLRSDFFVPESIKILGDAPIDPQRPALFPSDHFGLTGSIVHR
jgi:poly(A) polymerase